jgi:hypothetical protein
MISIGQRLNAVKSEPRWSTPNGNVPAFKPDTPRLLGAELASKQENRWQPKRERNDGASKLRSFRS